MKKIFALLIGVICLLSSVACGGKTQTGNTPKIENGDVVLSEGEYYVLKCSEAAEWQTSSSQILSVKKLSQGDYAGVTALREGKAVVYAQSGGKTASCNITVVKTKIRLDGQSDEAVIDLSSPVYKLNAVVENSEDTVLTYASDYYAVAEVSSDGTVLAKRPGEASITVSHSDGVSVKIKITVTGEYVAPDLPATVSTAKFKSASHVQGIAMDSERKFLYYTFTDTLVKTDLNGNTVGTMSGFKGHMGDCTFNEKDGKLYASLFCEGYGWTKATAAYVAIIDVSKINRVGMRSDDGLMKTVFIKEFSKDFYADLNGDGVIDAANDRRYCTESIDAVAFGPAFGKTDGKQYLTIGYGVALDVVRTGGVSRTDNDYQVLLQYDAESWNSYAQPLDEDSPHTSGPDRPDGKYFIYTGNTDYGIQVMEYDSFTKKWFFVCYPGNKTQFPKAYTFTVDAADAPYFGELKGQSISETAALLKLSEDATQHASSGVRYWTFWQANTGLISLGDGTFYVSNSNRDGEYYSTVVDTWRFTGKQPAGMEKD